MKLRTADFFNAPDCLHRRRPMGNSAVRGKKRKRGAPAAASGKNDSPQGTQGITEEGIRHPDRSEAEWRGTLRVRHRECTA